MAKLQSVQALTETQEFLNFVKRDGKRPREPAAYSQMYWRWWTIVTETAVLFLSFLSNNEFSQETGDALDRSVS